MFVIISNIQQKSNQEIKSKGRHWHHALDLVTESDISLPEISG